MQNNKNRVLVLGHGEMGRAMEFLLASRHLLRIWQRHPSPDLAPVDLETAVPESDVILFCLPAVAHASVAALIAPYLQGATLCLTIAKGLDAHGRLPAEILAEAVGLERVVVLYGPMISEEIRAGKPAFSECGTPRDTAYPQINALFRGTTLHIKQSRDITGLSWSAVLKNVYAMAFGMADELHLGDNARGLLTVIALHELSALVQHLGGERTTPYQLAGLGDLITTATSAGSHHHELGRLIVRNTRNALTGEGVHTLNVLRNAGRFTAASFPLFNLIDACLLEPGAARAQITEFFRNSAI